VPVIVLCGEELLGLGGDELGLLVEVPAPHDEDVSLLADAREQLVLHPDPGVPYDGFSVVSGSESATPRTSSSVITGPTVVSERGALLGVRFRLRRDRS
jgi:hypothetical protein